MQLLFLANRNKKEKNVIDNNQLHGTQKTITEVVAYINNNFQTELNLESISAAFYIDSCYLSRIFKKTVGMSFVDYINNVRVMEAKKLLSATDKSIISISENVGFKSNTHFGRVFKKIIGLSPLQYRKQKRAVD
jgi:YesN/AraC family two-component response regulator